VPQVATNRLQVQEVAEAPSWTVRGLELATGLVEVSDGRELGINGLAIEPAIVHVRTGLLRIFLVLELGVRVTCQVL